MEQLKLSYIDMKMQNGTTTLKISVAVSYKVKYKLT